MDLNQDVLHLWSKFGDPTLNERWVIVRASSWLTHTHTDTQTQPMTIPEGQNWPRIKMSMLWSYIISWLCQDMGMHSALLALCEENQPVNNGWTPQNVLVMMSFDVFCVAPLKKLVNRQSNCRSFGRSWAYGDASLLLSIDEADKDTKRRAYILTLWHTISHFCEDIHFVSL